VVQDLNTIHVSDAVAWDHCSRHAWFVLRNSAVEDVETDRFEKLIKTLGDEHEAEVLTRFDIFRTAKSVAHTQELVEAQVPVIYQPKFFDAELNLAGVPDFLLLEGKNYRVADAKLALSVSGKRAIKAQLSTYRRLARSQLPAVVFLGDGETVEIEPEDDAIGEAFVSEMQALRVEDVQPETHYSYTKCSACQFRYSCVPEFKQADDITLNPAIQARAAEGLRRVGIKTLATLANIEPEKLPDVPYLKGEARKRRAVLQARSLRSGEVIKINDINLPAGDYLHFDIESDPMARAGRGEVYLWGFLTPTSSDTGFKYVWKERDDDADEDAWSRFLAMVDDFCEQFQKPYFVHYSNYERVQIQRYADRYGDQSHEIVKWLLADGGPLLDLRTVVKDAYVLPLLSYGLKMICRDPRLVNFQWRLDESGSQWSVVRYYDYLDAGTDAAAAEIKAEILTYNEDDVRATQALTRWLERMETEAWS